jgi:hypothetical protein
MKLLLTLFLLGLLGQTESKSVIPQYKHTSYFYNSTQCNNSVPTIVEFVNYDNCDINNLNKCLESKQSLNKKNGSVFKTCTIEPLIYNTNVKTSVILTILLMFLAFLMYKICCQPELDNVCLKMKYKCEDWFCCNEDDETQYINDYNSL